MIAAATHLVTVATWRHGAPSIDTGWVIWIIASLAVVWLVGKWIQSGRTLD